MPRTALREHKKVASIPGAKVRRERRSFEYEVSELNYVSCVWAGKNGQLGHGSTGKLDDPTLIKALATHMVTHIAAGSRLEAPSLLGAWLMVWTDRS